MKCFPFRCYELATPPEHCITIVTIIFITIITIITRISPQSLRLGFVSVQAAVILRVERRVNLHAIACFVFLSLRAGRGVGERKARGRGKESGEGGGKWGGEKRGGGKRGGGGR